MTQPRLAHRFVETMPEMIEPRVLYVSTTFRTALHACPCGCGSEVVTPIGREGWSMLWDGETASLAPSVGNEAPCRSHYLVVRNRVIWLQDQGRETSLLRRLALKLRGMTLLRPSGSGR